MRIINEIPSLKWDIVKIPIHEKEVDAMVAAFYEDNRIHSYWVVYGGLIDAIVRPGGGIEVVGIGAKKFYHEISRAVTSFKYQLAIKKEPYETKGEKFLRVINGGKN